MSPSPSTTEIHPSASRDLIGPIVLVACGAPPVELGRRIPVDRELTVGRDAADFSFAPKTVSRRHASLVGDRDRLVVRDLGSRLGTFVNGARIDECSVTAGDLVTAGELGLLVAFAPRRFVPSAAATIDHWSWTMAQVIDEARAMGLTDRPLAFTGEPGVGKRRLAELVVRDAGAPRAALVLDAAAVTVDNERIALAQPEDIVLFERMSEASPAHIAACAELIRRRERGERAPRVVLTLTDSGPEPATVPVELLRYFEGTTLRVPSLTERPEDILPIAYRRLRELANADVAIGTGMALRLLRRRFAGNVRSLLAEVERAWAKLAGDPRVLETGEGVDAVAGSPVLIAKDASFIVNERGERSVLERRPALRLILRALLAAWPSGQVLSARELCEAGWPGERMNEESATNRVYVSIATLRRLGLAQHLRSVDGGYRLVDEGTLRVVAGASTRGSAGEK